jgi:hypothetical protein
VAEYEDAALWREKAALCNEAREGRMFLRAGLGASPSQVPASAAPPRLVSVHPDFFALFVGLCSVLL